MTAAFIVSARRTAVVPRGGAFAKLDVGDLSEALMRLVLDDAAIEPADVDQVIFGNTLYGGGNPARLAALKAGVPETVPACTVDTQCCSGLDAILLASSLIKAGEADVIIAGGVESFSRSPIRARRPLVQGDCPKPYDRPPFTPWPDRDPDMIPAAAALALELNITRFEQESFAMESHRKALASSTSLAELACLCGQTKDPFGRGLNARVCERLPILAGRPTHGVTAATVAVEADAAAMALLVSSRMLNSIRHPTRLIRLAGGERAGGDPERPGLAPITAARTAMQRAGIAVSSISVAEIMEAFAVQAIACIRGIGIDPERVNPSGGALARGHPIGASGAIAAVRVWHELQHVAGGAVGLAAIAAAGGIGSAALFCAE